MQVSIETTSGLERRLTVGVPAERVENEVDNRLKKAAKNVRLDGFRPGKVPMKVMQASASEPGVRQEVLGEVMSQSFQEAVNQEKPAPCGPAFHRAPQHGRGQRYRVCRDLRSVSGQSKLADMKGVEISRPKAEVTDADVDNIIEVFRKPAGPVGRVAERAAEDDDQVNYRLCRHPRRRGIRRRQRRGLMISFWARGV